MSAAGLVQLHGVVVAHHSGDTEVRALDGVDFDVARGESVALWGPSGSGKTTLLHVLGGLVTPSSGRALWRDEPLLPIQVVAEAGTRTQRVAYVFQGSKLLPTLTAYENVAFARWACGNGNGNGNSHVNGNGNGNGHAAAVRSPDELLALVGLEGKLDALPGELSGGEAQRVAIARALGQSPELMLCDEPTGQLDTDTGQRVLDLIDALRSEVGFTLVTATHDIGVARRYDRMVELEDGHIVDGHVVHA
jgi:putative ABC transport system ATP-binding protein